MITTEAINAIPKPENYGRPLTSIDEVVSRYTDPNFLDCVSLSHTARKIINDDHGLLKNFQMNPEDYRISKKELAFLKEKMPGRIDDYNAVLKVMEENHYIIAANMRTALGKKIATCYVLTPGPAAVSGSDGTKNVYGRNKNLIELILGSKNFDKVMKTEDGKYKNPADVNLSELHNVEFYKNELDAKTDLNSTYGFGMKWCYCPSKK